MTLWQITSLAGCCIACAVSILMAWHSDRNRRQAREEREFATTMAWRARRYAGNANESLQSCRTFARPFTNTSNADAIREDLRRHPKPADAELYREGR